MLLRFRILLMLSFSALCLFSQTEGTIIEVQLSNYNKQVTAKDTAKYSVELTEPFRGQLIFNKGVFRVPGIHWYRDEVMQLIIIHGDDTMQVNFEAGFRENKKRSMLVTHFFLAIPFQRGVYRVSSLVFKDNKYRVKDDELWKPVQ